MFYLFIILITTGLVLKAHLKELTDLKIEPDTNLQYPFVVLIKMTERNGYCTGALVTSKWVLTAAHCVSMENNVTVYVNSFTRTYDNKSITDVVVNKSTENSDTTTNSYQPSIQERTSVQIVLPWVWAIQIRQTFGVSDIALIEVEDDFDTTHFSRRVPMPTSPELPVKKDSCKIVGHGNIDKDNIAKSQVLSYDLVVEEKCSSNKKLVDKSKLKRRNWICQVDDESLEQKFVEGGSLLLCDGDHKNELNGIAVGIFKLDSQKDVSENKVVFMNICPYLTMIRSYVGHSVIPSPGWQGSQCFTRSSSSRTELTVLRAPEFVMLMSLFMCIKLFV